MFKTRIERMIDLRILSNPESSGPFKPKFTSKSHSASYWHGKQDLDPVSKVKKWQPLSNYSVLAGNGQKVLSIGNLRLSHIRTWYGHDSSVVTKSISSKLNVNQIFIHSTWHHSNWKQQTRWHQFRTGATADHSVQTKSDNRPTEHPISRRRLVGAA